MGKIAEASWIGAPEQGPGAPLFREEFELAQSPVTAHLHISGLGYYEAWLNGERVGDHVLDPAQTEYQVRVFYVTYDVLDMLHSGRNAIGVMLGHGWYNQDKVWTYDYGQARLMAQLHIEYADGSTQLVADAPSWRCSPGPVIYDNVYAGERYHAGLEQPGWAVAGFDDSRWRNAVSLPPPGGDLQEQDIPPIRRIEELKPVSITELGPGRYVVDMGQNFSGWCRIRVQAEAGTEIKMRFAEELGADGNIDTASTGVFATEVEQTDIYVCKGGGIEKWEPRFCYHGFRYVEISGWPGEITDDDLKGVVVHTDLKSAGYFECSDARLNTLHRMAVWTHRSNVHSIPEDCPARERCGWLGDAHIVAEFSMWNFHSKEFWEKYLGDIETARPRNQGLPPRVAPGLRGSDGVANPDWAAALILIPWYVYVQYGDKGILSRHHEGMTRLMKYFREKAPSWILEGGYGDWFDPGGEDIVSHTEPKLTTTLWFLRCADIITIVEQLLGNTEKANEYREWADCIREAFISRFYDLEKGTFGSQTAAAMALHFDAIQEGERSRVVESLVQNIRQQDTHQVTGIMGVRYLYEVLSRHGHGELVLELMHQNTYPSFGDLIGRGATTLWESWGEKELDDRTGVRSRSHPMFGGYDNWFFNTLAGIRPDPERPGFKHFFVEPHPIHGVEWVRCYHDCAFGRIESNWQYAEHGLDWEIVVPEGTCASVSMSCSGEYSELGPGKHGGREKL